MFLTFTLCIYAKLNFFEKELFICLKMDFALDDLQRLIYNETKKTKNKLSFHQNARLYLGL